MVDVELLDIRFETTSDGSTCENLFYTCCMERLAEPIVTPNPHPEKCGIRNIKGVVFEFKPHDNEAQFGKPLISIFIIRTSHSVELYCDESLNS